MLIFNKLKEKKIYVILIILISLIGGLIISLKLSEKEYISSSTLLLVKTEQLSEEEIKGLGNLEISDKLISTFEEILKSDTTVQKIKSELNLSIENKDLTRNIHVKSNTNSDTFQIEVKNLDEQNSININNKLVNIFSDKLKEMYSNTNINVLDNAHIIKIMNNISMVFSTIISLIIGMIISGIYLQISILIEKNIKINKDIENEINLKKLIEIPLKVYKKDKTIKSELIAYDNEKTDTSKAFSNLRSNIQFINVNNNEKKTILITSPSSKEGKSYISANIAISFAEVGKKVILIDSDMKNGRQSELFNIPNNLGFSNYLSNLDSNGVEISKLTNNFINETAIKNLNIITSGTIPPNTSELLTSDRLSQLIKDLSVFYDVVIIDGTSALNSLDALILSRVCNATILVSDYKKTKKEDILKAKRDIQNVGGNPTGIIVNKIKIKKENNYKEEIKKFFSNCIIKTKNDIEKISNLIKNRKEKGKTKLLEPSTEIKEKNKIKFDKKENRENKFINNKNKEKVVNLFNKFKSYTLNFIIFIKKYSLKVAKKLKIFSINIINFSKKYGSKIIKNTIKYSSKFLNKVKTEFIKFTKYIKPIIKNFMINTKSNFVKIVSNIKKKIEEIKLAKKQKIDKELKKEDITNNSIQNNQIKKDNIKNKKNVTKPTEKNSLNEDIEKQAVPLVNSNVRISNKSQNTNNKTTLQNDNKIKPINNVESKITNTDDNKIKSIIDNNFEIKVNNIKSNKKETIEKKDNSKISSINSKDMTNKIELEDLENEKGDNAVLVIVDAEKACCRVFSKYYYTEKLIKGIDKNDGFKKNEYSIQLMKTRINGLMSLYGLNKKQVKRIDTLIYTTLLDYDDCAWLDKKIISNRAESYVLSMAKEYDRLPNESKQDYIVRCQRLRKQELEKAEIDIEYKLDNLLRNNKISIPNKITLKHFADLYEIKESLKSNQEIEKSTENKKFYVDIVKTIKGKLEVNTVSLDDNKYIEDENSGFYELEEGEEKVIDYEKEEKVKKRQERMENFKEKLKEQTELFSQKREEKIKKQEELKKQKDEERQRLREEARIEEELLVNNLYPKTKNNRNIYK